MTEQRTANVGATCPGCGKPFPSECDWCSEDIPRPTMNCIPTSKPSLAWRLVAYSIHTIQCGIKYGQRCEERTASVLSPCTCGLQALIEEARAADEPAGTPSLMARALALLERSDCQYEGCKDGQYPTLRGMQECTWHDEKAAVVAALRGAAQPPAAQPCVQACPGHEFKCIHCRATPDEVRALTKRGNL